MEPISKMERENQSISHCNVVDNTGNRMYEISLPKIYKIKVTGWEGLTLIDNRWEHRT